MPSKVATSANGAGQVKEATDKPYSYKTGHPDEQTFMNFQTTKGTKRAFNAACKRLEVNKSEFFRKCMEALVESGGDLKQAMKKIEGFIAELKFKKTSSLSKL